MLRVAHILALGAALAAFSARAAEPAGPAPEPAPVAIEYFFEPGCSECLIVSNRVLPGLKQRYEGSFALSLYDIGNPEDYRRLARYQERLGIQRNEPVCIIIDRRFVLNGLPEIQAGLLARVDQCIGERLSGAAAGAPAEAAPAGGAGSLLDARARQWTLPFVMTAGLVDGINPCAISTLVFFVSLLSLARARARGILLMGICFCAASFVTYTAIGFGLMRFLHVWTGFPILRAGLETLMIALLAALAYLSFRDAWRFRRSGNPADISLQLPAGIRDRIHRILKSGLGFRSLALGGAVTGAAVTALESVCTGQLLVPSLVLIIESGQNVRQAAGLLLAYNIMFVVPLVVIFVLSWLGMETGVLVRWSRKNVVMSKILLGVLFLALVAAMLALRGEYYQAVLQLLRTYLVAAS